MSDIETQGKFRRAENIVKREIAGSTLLVPVVGELAQMRCIFDLNATGELIWDLLDGSTSSDDINSRIAETFSISHESLGQDTADFLEELKRAHLITRVDNDA